MRDLENPKWIFLKAGLFVVIGLISSSLIIAYNPQIQICLLLFVAIWSCCRAYYFAFYVLQKYVDPNFKFSGLFSALKYLVSRS